MDPYEQQQRLCEQTLVRRKGLKFVANSDVHSLGTQVQNSLPRGKVKPQPGVNLFKIVSKLKEQRAKDERIKQCMLRQKNDVALRSSLSYHEYVSNVESTGSLLTAQGENYWNFLQTEQERRSLQIAPKIGARSKSTLIGNATFIGAP